MKTKVCLSSLKKKPTLFGGDFDPEGQKKELAALEQQTTEPDFWSEKQKADSVFTKINSIKDVILPFEQLIKEINETYDLIELYEEEDDNNPEYQAEIDARILELQNEFRPLKLKTLLNGKYDKGDMFLTIHAGAGGTEACDWTSMLMRMYLRWCEKHKYKTEILDTLEDEGGYKSVTIQVSGPYAFGYLKGEAGVHRLVRISPFDSNARRHTSFSSVYASPVVEDNIDIEIKPEDIRIDTYRAGGAGGQHVNKTDSAVRITHYPTGIVVQCQNERSQQMNKDFCFKMLRSRLYDYYSAKLAEQHAAEAIEKKDISWGSQIRSYVFQPYTMVKDNRTGTQTGNIQAVMDGDLDDFIESFLRWNQEK